MDALYPFKYKIYVYRKCTELGTVLKGETKNIYWAKNI